MQYVFQVQDEDLFLRLSLEQSDLWLDFQSSGDLHTISRLNLSPFEVILAVAALRPESCYRAIVAFVDQVLGIVFFFHHLFIALFFKDKTH